MKCRKVRRILTEEIQSADAREVREHLEACDECRALHRDLFSLKHLSGELKGRMEPPPFFAQRVCSRTVRMARPAYWKLAAIAAGLIFLAIGIANLASLSKETAAPVTASVTDGGEGIQKIDNGDVAISASEIKHQPEVFSLQGDEWELTATDRLTFRSEDNGMVPQASSPSYLFELPATIEVRQTQAENEFYLQNVSH